MDKPTGVQIKVFWEKYGVDEYHDWTDIGDTEYEYCKKCGCILEFAKLPCQPPIDLNNLFKYAVPKLDYMEMKFAPSKLLPSVKVERKNSESGVDEPFYSRGDTRALALFWALDKVRRLKK